MAKSSKTLKDTAPTDPSAAAAPAPAAQSSAGAPPSENPTSKKSTRTARKRSSPPARKTATVAKTKKAAAPKRAKPVEFIISDEDIRQRAYFIAQHRALSGLNGDSASDWLEARRQLFDEASRLA